MGLLGAKTTIYVASTVYNMAGEQENRINFLKTLIGSKMIGNTKFSMSETLTSTYLAGPGIKIRGFHRWCRDDKNFGKIGVPKMNVVASFNLDMITISALIPVTTGQTATASKVLFGVADPSYWAGQWILENDPTKISSEWFCSWDEVTNLITITWADDTTTTFTPTDYDPVDGEYVYITYTLKTSSSFLGSHIWIYRKGTGVGYLDSLLTVPVNGGEVVPYIPIRRDSKFFSTTNNPDVYEQASKAYTKFTGRRGKKGLPELIDKINDNEDIDDVDHAYIFPGVSLNTKDKSGKKYLWKFFDFLRTSQPYSSSAFDDWETAQQAYEADMEAFIALRASLDPSELGGPTDPAVTGTIPQPPQSPVSSVKISNDGDFDTKLDIEIKWKKIKKITGSGLQKPTAKVGDIWFDLPFNIAYNVAVLIVDNLFNGSDSQTEMVTVCQMHWQKTKDHFETLQLIGLNHINNIYKDTAVIINGAEALLDLEDSGFIVPLHYDTLKSMSLVDSTQVMTIANNIIFNSYLAVKQKWYQTTVFQIFIFIVIIAITVAFPPAGAAASGLLGTAAGVGAALGFTGLIAVIVGTIANTLAAMILMRIISMAAVELLGDKLGAIVAVIASAVAMQVGTALSNGMSMTAMWGNMMSASNLMMLTSSLAKGVNGYIRASTMGIMEQNQELLEESQKEMDRITAMFNKEFGQGDFHFDPKQLTDVDFNGVFETPSMFLDRTLLTGSDIAEMTLDMLTSFADNTISVNTIGG